MNTEDRKDPPEKKDRTEPEGTIPNEKDGVGLTSSDEANTFEEEEDPEQGPDDAQEKRRGSSGEKNDGG